MTSLLALVPSYRSDKFSSENNYVFRTVHGAVTQPATCEMESFLKAEIKGSQLSLSRIEDITLQRREKIHNTDKII